jgi:hypothetical protein
VIIMVAGRHGVEQKLKVSLCKQEAERNQERDWAWCGPLNPQRSLPVTLLLQQSHTLSLPALGKNVSILKGGGKGFPVQMFPPLCPFTSKGS